MRLTIRRFEAAGLTWPLSDDVTDTELEARLFASAGAPIPLIAPSLKVGLDSFRRTKGERGCPLPLVTESSSRVPRDDARMELCGVGFAFSELGDLCLFSGFRRNQSRVGGSCGGSVAA